MTEEQIEHKFVPYLVEQGFKIEHDCDEYVKGYISIHFQYMHILINDFTVTEDFDCLSLQEAKKIVQQSIILEQEFATWLKKLKKLRH